MNKLKSRTSPPLGAYPVINPKKKPVFTGLHPERSLDKRPFHFTKDKGDGDESLGKQSTDKGKHNPE